MRNEFKAYQPIVPVETILSFGQEVKRWEWYPYPSRGFWDMGKGRQIELLDNADTVNSLTSQMNLQGYLEAIDLTVGCRYPCQTCIRDSQALSSIMSLEAAKKLIQSPGFADLLPE